VVNREIIVFSTTNAVAAMDAGYGKPKGAGQSGVKGKTSAGIAMPIEHIDGLCCYSLNEWIWSKGDNGWEWMESNASWLMKDTNAKGRCADQCVQFAAAHGAMGFPPCKPKVTSNMKQQISGSDMVLTIEGEDIVIQVKCDWKSGKRPKGWGNVYLETAEANPLRRH
jgi:hypothetical protein